MTEARAPQAQHEAKNEKNKAPTKAEKKDCAAGVANEVRVNSINIMSENKTAVTVGIMPADVFSAPPLGAKAACDKNDVVKGVPEAKSGAEASLDESTLKKDPAAEKDPAADKVDSDKAKAMSSAHAPSPNAVVWSKLERPTDPPTAPNGTKEAPALKPVTEDAPAFKPVTAGGAPLPSIKEEPAPSGIADWTTPSNPRRKNGRKGASAPIVRTKSITPVGGKNGFGALLGTDGNEGILGGTGKVPRGSTPSTTDSGATVDVETTTNTTPEGSAAGRFSWPKSYNLPRLFGILALFCLGAGFAHSSYSATSALLSSQRYDSPWPTSPPATVAKPFTPASLNGFCILENPIEEREKAAAHFTTDEASFTTATIHSKIEAGQTDVTKGGPALNAVPSDPTTSKLSGAYAELASFVETSGATKISDRSSEATFTTATALSAASLLFLHPCAAVLALLLAASRGLLRGQQIKKKKVEGRSHAAGSVHLLACSRALRVCIAIIFLQALLRAARLARQRLQVAGTSLLHRGVMAVFLLSFVARLQAKESHTPVNMLQDAWLSPLNATILSPPMYGWESHLTEKDLQKRVGKQTFESLTQATSHLATHSQPTLHVKGFLPLSASPCEYHLTETLFVRGALWRSYTQPLCTSLVVAGDEVAGPQNEARTCVTSLASRSGQFHAAVWVFVPAPRPLPRPAAAATTGNPTAAAVVAWPHDMRGITRFLRKPCKHIVPPLVRKGWRGGWAKQAQDLCNGQPDADLDSLQNLLTSEGVPPAARLSRNTRQLMKGNLVRVATSFTLAALTLPQPFAMVESGNLCGATTAILALLKLLLCPSCTFMSADPGFFRLVQGSSLECAAQLLAYAGLREQVQLHDSVTTAVPVPDLPVGFVFVDDGKARFYNEPLLSSLSTRLMLGSVIAFDDSWDARPVPFAESRGVNTHMGQALLAIELFEAGDYEPMAVPPLPTRRTLSLRVRAAYDRMLQQSGAPTSGSVLVLRRTRTGVADATKDWLRVSLTKRSAELPEAPSELWLPLPLL